MTRGRYRRTVASDGNRLLAAVYDLVMVPSDWAGLSGRRRRVAGLAQGTVLEIGVGTGLNLPAFDRARIVVGIDPDRHMLRRARRRARSAPCPVWFVQGSAHDLPLRSGAVDTAVVSLSLCTIPDPAAALGEIRRVLTPDGTLVFLEHVRSNHPATARFQDRITPAWRKVAGGCHANRRTVEEIEAAGFEITALWRSRSSSLVQGTAVARAARDG